MEFSKTYSPEVSNSSYSLWGLSLSKTFVTDTKVDWSWPEELKEISDSAKDLVGRLLDKNYKTRLGSLPGRYGIKSHPFFKNIDWADLVLRKNQLLVEELAGKENGYFESKQTNIWKVILLIVPAYSSYGPISRDRQRQPRQLGRPGDRALQRLFLLGLVRGIQRLDDHNNIYLK